jgi:hypothetical protein
MLVQIFISSSSMFTNHVCLPMQSTTDAARGNLYGIVTTSSFIQCGGITGGATNDFQLDLITNTALTNTLKATAIYSLRGCLMMLGSGQPLKLTYTDSTSVKLPPIPGAELDLINKTNVVGLGHMTSQEEVADVDSDSPTCLEVIVSHNDWDAVVRFILPIHQH